MKKLSSVLALLAVAGLVLASGCSKSEEAPKTPETPSTNAPAAP